MPILFSLTIIVVLCIVAWLVFCALIAWNGLSLLSLKDIEIAPLKAKPLLTVIIPACNEATTIENALQSLRQSDYPNLEILLVNDRSTDETGAIIDRMAVQDKRIRPIHITTLPEGWLGKVHALYTASKEASGDFLLFTDADVHFQSDTLSRTLAYMEASNLDHLTMLPETRAVTAPSVFSQAAVSLTIAGFAALFLYGLRLRKVRQPDSTAFVGVGAFNMVRRSTFAKTKGWEWLKMDVIDDVGLGKMMKESGAHCDALNGVGCIHLEWYPSVKALAQGFEKNFFAGIGRYRWSVLLWRITQLAAVVFLPYFAAALALVFGGGASLLLAVFCALNLLPLLFALPFRRKMPVSPYLLGFLPIAFLTVIAIMLRSAWIVTRNGGISWRGTFYPLETLRREQRVQL
ncbi:MAG: glycosyltransferase family 2 protein [Candidatus Kapabacteria bacterium]|jgi:glycosyltransferase involved in cell wall biosynthesis|nr:glycosyltransferase family 2 protein [Candidatus Kapabacteria bacterium]